MAGSDDTYVVGVDYGTLPGGVTRLGADWALQFPGDHVDVLRTEVPEAVAYGAYTRLHDHFGRGGDDVMHELRDLRREVLAR